MKNRWRELGMFYRIAMMLIILGLLTMIIGLILIATTKYTVLLSTNNGFDYLEKNGISYVLNNSSATGFSNGAWMQLQWGVGLAVIATPILFGTVIISIIIGFFAMHGKTGV